MPAGRAGYGGLGVVGIFSRAGDDGVSVDRHEAPSGFFNAKRDRAEPEKTTRVRMVAASGAIRIAQGRTSRAFGLAALRSPTRREAAREVSRMNLRRSPTLRDPGSTLRAPLVWAELDGERRPLYG